MRAVIDPHVEAGSRELRVRQGLPALSKLLHLHLRRRSPLRQQPFVLSLEIGLLAEPFRRDDPRRHQQVDVVIALVHLVMGNMDRQVDGDAVPIGDVLRELLRELFARIGRQLVRQRDLHLTGHPRILARLLPLGLVPQQRAIPRPGCFASLRQHDLSVGDTTLARVVVNDAVPLVDETRRRTIGGGGHGAPTGAPRDRLHRGVKNRQGQSPLPE